LKYRIVAIDRSHWFICLQTSVESINFVILPELSTKELQQLAIQFRIQVQKVIDLLWLFLELHMLKLMLLSIMLLCVFDVSDAASQQ
jgi:hypothetical protein